MIPFLNARRAAAETPQQTEFQFLWWHLHELSLGYWQSEVPTFVRKFPQLTEGTLQQANFSDCAQVSQILKCETSSVVWKNVKF